MTDVPRSWQEVSSEALALVADAGREGLTIRVVGSAGVRLHCEPSARALDAAARPPAKDIDLVCLKESRKPLRRFLEARGYVVDRDLMVAMEGRRFSFAHKETGLELDVFVEELAFCHTVEVRGRLDRHPVTIPLEELLLHKLQIAQLTVSDLMDLSALVVAHPIEASPDDGEKVDARFVAGVLAHDWGFHHTAVANLIRLRDELLTADQGTAADRVTALIDAIEAAPKSARWRLRSRLGERVQWWEDVDDRQATY